MQSTSQETDRGTGQQILPDPNSLPDLSKPNDSKAYSLYDALFWRDVPDWYNKTFAATGFGLCFFTTKQYLERNKLEVFLPPRARILTPEMQKGYRTNQMLRAGLVNVGLQTLATAAGSGIYFAGAFYLGESRGKHDWTNFAASGAAAGTALSIGVLWPPKPRTVVLGTLFGAMMGAFSGGITQLSGLPFWDLSHDFEGWFLGEYVNKKAQRQAAQQQQQQLQESQPLSGGSS